MRSCTVCTKTKIKTTVEKIIERSNASPASVEWILWEKDTSGKRYIKKSKEGPIGTLIEHFIAILDKFLKHSYTKRVQANIFENDRKEMELIENAFVELLQIDFAENFTCEAQDEIQSAHWNQKTVSRSTSSNNFAPIKFLRVNLRKCRKVEI